MLRVRVELLPGGIPFPVTLSELHVVNDGTGDRDIGNYDVFGPDLSWRIGRIEGFCRSLGCDALVARALELARDKSAGTTQNQPREVTPGQATAARDAALTNREETPNG